MKPLPDLATCRREATIRRLECEALTAARSLERRDSRPPITNPRVLAVLKLAGEFFRGERIPSQYTRTMARVILANCATYQQFAAQMK
jgi:hypothetical protein